MNKKGIAIISAIGIVAGVLIYRFSTDTEMKTLFAKELNEKKNEIVTMVKTGELPKKDPMDRVVKVDGLINMRDLGDVKTPHGDINKRMLYRSETLYNLTDKGVKDFEKMNFDVVVDFRGDDEIEHHPDKGLNGTKYLQIPVSNPASIMELIPEEHIKEIRSSFAEGDYDRFNELLDKYNLNLDEQKKDSYIGFGKEFNKEFSKFVHILLEKENKKVLFHCEGGKDRTGYAAVLFYKLLGADEEVYMDDFMMTNTLTAEQNAPILEKLPDSLRPTIIADRAHMEAVLDYIDEAYGSFDNYRKDELGISDIELQYLIEKYTD